MNLGRPHQLHVNFCSLALLTHRSSLAWENSQTYASHHQLVSPWDYTWGTTTDVTAQNLVVFQIGWSKLPSQQWPIRSTTQIRVVTHHHCGISPVVPLKPRAVRCSQPIVPLVSMDHRFDESYPFVYIGHVCLGKAFVAKKAALSSRTFIWCLVCGSFLAAWAPACFGCVWSSL